jgi:Flp pilus assembly protein TadB
MLDEQDRRALFEIERGLSRQDPAFVTRMRGQGEDRRFPTVLALCVSIYLVVPMVALLLGWIAAVVAFDAFAVTIAVVLVRRRRRARR